MASHCLIAQTPKFTKPTNFDDVPVYRLQIIFTTANVSDAGTDDPVYIQLNSDMRPYYLDYGIDDRERNRKNEYDIVEPNVRFIKDIKQLNITKVGNDGWAISKIEIRVNGFTIFTKTLNKHWIDGNGGGQPVLNFTAAQLRSNGKWNYNVAPNIYIPPLTISKKDLVSMVEGFVGNYIRYIPDEDVQWGSKGGVNTIWGDAVEAKYRNPRTLAFDLDLQVAKFGPNPELDIDFDLVVSCNNGKVLLNIENAKVNVNFLSKFKVAKMNLDLSNYLNRSFNVPNCNAHFNSNGSLSFL
ncbi:MAG: hypothetical protein JNN28_02785 [Saprospiraceae bacterium]|nr:hypothetical protein [Saprospiraceae bacterium]